MSMVRTFKGVITWFMDDPLRIFIAFLLVAMVSCVDESCHITVSINSQPSMNARKG
jgi:hypothetical protein